MVSRVRMGKKVMGNSEAWWATKKFRKEASVIARTMSDCWNDGEYDFTDA